MLFLVFGSSVMLLKLDPWANGSEPGAALDDEAEVKAAEEAWGVAYSVFAADATFSAVLLCLAICQLTLFGTGLSNVRALMAFRVPVYQRMAATGLIFMGLVALYAQATKDEGAGEEWNVLLWPVFFAATLVFVLALGCGLPLKKVINGNRADSRSSEGPNSSPLHHVQSLELRNIVSEGT